MNFISVMSNVFFDRFLYKTIDIYYYLSIFIDKYVEKRYIRLYVDC